MIVDCHTHAFQVEGQIEPCFLEESSRARNGVDIDWNISPERHREAMKDVDRAIIFGIKARHVGIHTPDEFIANFVKSDPKLIGFCSVDPNEEGFLEKFEYAAYDLKLCGIKLGPMYANFSPLDPRLFPVYETAITLGLPVLAHTGTTFCQYAPLEVTRPILIDELAMKFPDLTYIMAHLGHPWESEALVVIRKHPNVWSDLSALFYRPWQQYNSLILAQEYGVMHKILFGSDFPFATPGDTIRGLRSLNDMVQGTHLPRVSDTLLDEIIHRDTLSILFPHLSP